METAYWVALNHVPGIGSVTFTQLITHFGSAQKAWEAKGNELKPFLNKAVFPAFLEARSEINPATLMSHIAEQGITVLTVADAAYPALLKQIYDPPPVLYLRGEIKPADAQAIAIVGTRKMTSYGSVVTERLAAELVGQGFTIVSGLARGVDGAAHKAAVEAGGRTIAVLGGGLNNIYPREHEQLAQQIIDGHGAVISEFPPDFPAVPGNFPARNRIISGLSLGLVVTEAAEQSGTMITVGTALEQGREVFAVPGPITSMLSVGTMKLIKDGATLVTSAADILAELQIPTVASDEHKPTPTIDESTSEGKLLKLLETEPLFFDSIVKQLQKPAADVAALLTMLEIAGSVRQLDNNHWMRT